MNERFYTTLEELHPDDSAAYAALVFGALLRVGIMAIPVQPELFISPPDS